MAKKKRVGKKAKSGTFSKTKLELSQWFKTLHKIEHEIPAGVKVLLLFSILMGVIYLFFASMFSYTILFGIVLQGATARFFNILIILLIAFMIFGTFKRKRYGYNLANMVFSFFIFNSLVSMFFIKKGVSGLLNTFVTFSFFFILMMNVITLWYVKHQKKYFTGQYHPTHFSKDDKAYLFGMTFLWIIFIFTAGVMGSALYEETVEKIDGIFEVVYWAYPYEVEDYCLNIGEDKDLCLLTSAIVYEDNVNALRYCRQIDSQFYKYACFKAIEGDVL
ncbi:hypothetical protein GOV08_00565 [Candidatus Woesearchaeota archaeon]|nr:hypothetical protein [Candidatus Woesearchaeota archaeon]